MIPPFALGAVLPSIEGGRMGKNEARIFGCISITIALGSFVVGWFSLPETMRAHASSATLPVLAALGYFGGMVGVVWAITSNARKCAADAQAMQRSAEATMRAARDLVEGWNARIKIAENDVQTIGKTVEALEREIQVSNLIDLRLLQERELRAASDRRNEMWRWITLAVSIIAMAISTMALLK
jgi:hypothetical protein